MEKIPLILKEVREKKGREWLGLQKKTEDQLELLSKYLCQPQLQDNPRKAIELVGLYFTAKTNGFLKMEDIGRKLDQLRITYGKPDSTPIMTILKNQNAEKKETIIIDDYPKEIQDLKNTIEKFLESSLGVSSPESTKKSLRSFLDYLNHPNLENKPAIFDNMLSKYNVAEEEDFLKMQAFNDMLNMLEIKLGAVTKEMKMWKSPEEVKDELVQAKQVLDDEKLTLDERKSKLNEFWLKLMAEQEKFKEEKLQFEDEKKKFEDERIQFTASKESFNLEKILLEEGQKKLEAMRDKFEAELSKLSS